MTDDVRNIRRNVLPNGLTILTEEMQHIRSVSIGIWIKTGSRNEEAAVNGVSHFVEHMLFKGTTTRTAQDIARQVDSIGGHMDAFTGKECICFNIKVLDEHLPIAMDVLGDLVMNPLFNEEDIHRERGVILEEIKMDEDNPDYLVHEIFTQGFWQNHPLGKPILGTRQTVSGFEQSSVVEHYRSRFAPGNLIISAAGNLNHERFVEIITSRFQHLQPAPNGFRETAPEIAAPIITRNKKSLQQVQLYMGVPAPAIADERRFTCALLSTLLGGGMSSRLFQNIRENKGLVYSIYSDTNSYRDTACLAVCAGTSLESVPQVVSEVVKEFKEFKTPVSDEELRRGKDQVKGSLMLGLESSTSRMANLARQEMYFNRFFSLDEIIQGIEKVTAGDMAALARELFDPEKIAVTVLGNLNGLNITRSQLAC